MHAHPSQCRHKCRSALLHSFIEDPPNRAIGPALHELTGASRARLKLFSTFGCACMWQAPPAGRYRWSIWLGSHVSEAYISDSRANTLLKAFLGSQIQYPNLVVKAMSMQIYCGPQVGSDSFSYSTWLTVPSVLVCLVKQSRHRTSYLHCMHLTQAVATPCEPHLLSRSCRRLAMIHTQTVTVSQVHCCVKAELRCEGTSLPCLSSVMRTW